MRLLVVLVVFVCSITSLRSQSSNQKTFNLAESTSHYSYDELLDFVDTKLSDQKDIARFFYYWIGLNIKYDVSVNMAELSQPHYPRETEPAYIFKTRKATCMGYNNLYDSFLEYFGIIHKDILGYTRHSTNVIKNITPVMDHVWSAIYIDDQWHLVDVTWSVEQIQNPESRDHYFMTPSHIFNNDHLPLDAEWFLDGHEMSLEDFEKQPLFNPLYYGVTGLSDIPIKKEVNELGETVLYFPPMNGWRFGLAAVDKNGNKKVRLKYKMKRVKGAIKFTLKNYEPGMTLRLNATRKQADGTYASIPGLAYLKYPDWQGEKRRPFRQFSTKQDRFKK